MTRIVGEEPEAEAEIIRARQRARARIMALLLGAFVVLLFLINSGFYTGQATTGSDMWLMFYGMIGVSLPPLGVLIYLHNFEVQRWRDSDYSPYASSD